MNYGDLFLLAAVQGVTEFLPVSSSGHLILLESFMGLNIKNIFFFNILIHMATLLATIFFYRCDLIILFKNLIKESTTIIYKRSSYFSKKSFEANPSTSSHNLTFFKKNKNFPAMRFAGIVIVTTTVTGTIALIAKPWIKEINNMGILAVFFLINGVILWSSQIKKSSPTLKKELTLTDITIPMALIIGLAQGIAVLPGISRSGITITVGLFLGLNARESMKYSILISIPIITAVFLGETIELIYYNHISNHYWVYISASIISFLIGYLSLHFLFKIVKKHRIHLFAFYLVPLSLWLGTYFLIKNTNT